MADDRGGSGALRLLATGARVPLMQAEKTVRVLQWNVLADCLATADDKGFPMAPVAALDTEKRAEMQADILDTHAADVVCLQEVDEPSRFEQVLRDTHESIYAQRRDSALGLFFAWRKDMFELVTYRVHNYRQGGQVALLVILRRGDFSDYIFATTHLKSLRSDSASDMNREQFREFVAAVRDTVSEPIATVSGVFVAADLNDHHHTIDLTIRGVEHSMHNIYLGHTTFKKRGSGTKLAHEDMLASTRQCVNKLAIVAPESPYWPSETFPSDHAVLCGDFLL